MTGRHPLLVILGGDPGGWALARTGWPAIRGAIVVWGLSGGAVPLPLVVMQVLAIDLAANQIPAMALGSERAEPGTMSRPPRPRSEHLLDRQTFGRIAGIGSLEGIAAMACFFFAYLLAGWRPWEHLTGSGDLYLQATTMTMAGIVFAQLDERHVGVYLARGRRRSRRSRAP